MQRIHLCPKPLGSCTEWAVSYMRVTLCRGRVGVTEKAPDDLKAEATRNKVYLMRAPRRVDYLNIDPTGMTDAGYGPATK